MPSITSDTEDAMIWIGAFDEGTYQQADLSVGPSLFFDQTVLLVVSDIMSLARRELSFHNSARL